MSEKLTKEETMDLFGELADKLDADGQDNAGGLVRLVGSAVALELDGELMVEVLPFALKLVIAVKKADQEMKKEQN